MLDRVIKISFYILLFFTPLFFTSVNSELFEYNKMMLVYGLTAIVAGAWLLKMISCKSLIFNRTPLDIPIILFLLSQVLSTVFSIDPHTSIWGYYSRSNGGLLSILSYITLYYALVSNFDKSQAIKFLKTAVLGGFLVSLYAIPEHFGVSPSCILLTNSFSADCWVQDVQARVFATLGQPNWLAAYLGMLIFPAFYLLLATGKKVYVLILSCFYLAFTFTFSRGATLGLLGGMGVFLVLTFVRTIFFGKLSSGTGESRNYIRLLTATFAIFITINLVFGSALTGDFRLLQRSAPPARPGIVSQAPSGTQLENGGTESGQIRLIVWRGALDIWKHYPILGSGVETFAYSYYNFRPTAHNLVSEWDFLYNKAHNEYLNYLSTTGLVGFISYILVIFSFIVWSLIRIINSKSRIGGGNHTTNYLLLTAILASYISYLIQNFFGFSVVIIALFFYLFPGFVFVATEYTKPLNVKRFSFFDSFLYRRRIYTNSLKFLITLFVFYLLFVLMRYWIADTYYKNGQTYDDQGNAGRAYNNFLQASAINPGEPLYRSELGSAAASAALALFQDDATTSSRLKEEAVQETQGALDMSPKNISLWRTAIRTYYSLSLIDPQYEKKALETMDHAISLAPTDPKLYYNKALVLDRMGKVDQAIEVMGQAIKLKPNYREAYFTLGEFYGEKKQFNLAKEQFNKVLKLVPSDPDALKKLEEIASQSAEIEQ